MTSDWIKTQHDTSASWNPFPFFTLPKKRGLNSLFAEKQNHVHHVTRGNKNTAPGHWAPGGFLTRTVGIHNPIKEV